MAAPVCKPVAADPEGADFLDRRVLRAWSDHGVRGAATEGARTKGPASAGSSGKLGGPVSAILALAGVSRPYPDMGRAGRPRAAGAEPGRISRCSLDCRPDLAAIRLINRYHKITGRHSRTLSAADTRKGTFAVSKNRKRREKSPTGSADHPSLLAVRFPRPEVETPRSAQGVLAREEGIHQACGDENSSARSGPRGLPLGELV